MSKLYSRRNGLQGKCYGKKEQSRMTDLRMWGWRSNYEFKMVRVGLLGRTVFECRFGEERVCCADI